ncbi:winged helix-turn-helix transcriptional regulator [Streptosporangium sp. NBC_01756]|uniref:winged helix-turn-helix transcriptional regulator n=1 Tax=Streptosporangium sp. NBC_01756 TaxID=2975950 RepID=UPI002DDC413D|nr:helix-turn-helix domain-containing protein [Streptosporangium sp. NBC_01756]WSC83091.1 helix-turn-helix transcriptional regulator [Streptosporangium sp. NBC_01756]
MSGAHTDVPSMVVCDLPLPVTAQEHGACTVTDVLRRVGDKWSVLIVVLLGRGPRRFNELHRMIEEISQRMLTRTLRGLERDGLVMRTVHPTVPPSVEYALTDLGMTLLGPLSAVADWAVDHGADIASARAGYDTAEQR